MLVVSLLLYRNKKNVKREMKIAFLYRAQWGVKLIEYIGTKYKKTLNFLKWVIIPVCYLLMGGIIWLLGRSVYLYITQPIITDIVKAPPLAPVIPYFPSLFGMESFFPNFYFAYFIVALGIVAVVHEFAHGIFMRHNGVRIKSTGLAFFGPFMGAFVEQNDEDMNKLKKTDQLAILGAGVFSNLVFGILFLLLWIALFNFAFISSGAIFNGYTLTQLNTSNIDSIGNFTIQDHSDQGLLDLLNEEEIPIELTLENDESNLELIKITSNGQEYLITPLVFMSQLEKNIETNESVTLAYNYFPAIRAELKGTIIQIDEQEINLHSDLVQVMRQYSPGDTINIQTTYHGEVRNYDLTLVQDPNNETRGVLGIIYHMDGLRMDNQMAYSLDLLMKNYNLPFGFKEPYTKYEVKANIYLFFYEMIFWIVIINLLVALFNMLPAAILDGGRFFYLTIWGITKSETNARRLYKLLGYLILAAFLLIMFMWFIRITGLV
jgi:membrane-associated protease RseP (regulator of RpoE activity)